MRTRTFAAVAVVVACAVGGGVFALSHDHRGPRNSRTASVTLEQIDPAVPRGLDAASSTAPAVPLPPAAAPETAVRGLLDALIAGDPARSLSFLSAADRSTYGPVASWAAALSSLPHYLDYELGSTDGLTVATDVRIEPRLDEVVGYIPAQATVTWTTIPEDHGYRVSFAETRIDPVLPSDESARGAAASWVADRQGCRPGATYPGNLLGQPTLADALCHSPGTYRAEEATGLETFLNPTLLLDAFGPDASTFVRVVRLEGPTPFEVALAPLDETWQVVGLMET